MPRVRFAPPEDALARAALDGALSVRRGERLTVESWSHALPWARALLVAAQRRGVRPVLVLEDEESFFASLAAVGASRLQPPATEPFRNADAVIYLDGPESFPRLLGLPPMSREVVARFRSAARGSRTARTRSLRLRVADATVTAAERFDVDLGRWRSELVRASLVDPDRLALSGRALSRRLRPGRVVRVRHPNGTDLRLRLDTRAATVQDGIARPGGLAELPSGLWRARVARGSATGTFETNRVTYDRLAEAPAALLARLALEEGRVRDYEGDRSAHAFSAFVRTGRGRVRAHAIAIGLNPEVRSAPEVQPLAAGTVTLVLGDARSRRGASAPRFVLDASLAGATVEVDGRPVLVDGALPSPAAPRRARSRRSARVSRGDVRRAPRPWRERAEGGGPRSVRR
jgi:leucyl aminopeptidase (aminopeptidase T)